MARIDGVTPRKVSVVIRLSYFFSRRVLSRMLGRPSPVVEPFTIAAHRPWIMSAYGLHELALQRSRRLDFRLKELARARTGMLVGCPW